MSIKMHGRKSLKVIIGLFAVVFAMLLSLLFAGTVMAYDYTDPNTGNRIIIDDGAGVLTDAEIRMLAEDMKPALEFGNIMFVTADEAHSSGINYYAASIYHSYFTYSPKGVVSRAQGNIAEMEWPGIIIVGGVIRIVDGSYRILNIVKHVESLARITKRCHIIVALELDVRWLIDIVVERKTIGVREVCEDCGLIFIAIHVACHRALQFNAWLKIDG